MEDLDSRRLAVAEVGCVVCLPEEDPRSSAHLPALGLVLPILPTDLGTDRGTASRRRCVQSDAHTSQSTPSRAEYRER